MRQANIRAKSAGAYAHLSWMLDPFGRASEKVVDKVTHGQGNQLTTPKEVCPEVDVKQLVPAGSANRALGQRAGRRRATSASGSAYMENAPTMSACTVERANRRCRRLPVSTPMDRRHGHALMPMSIAKKLAQNNVDMAHSPRVVARPSAKKSPNVSDVRASAMVTSAVVASFRRQGEGAWSCQCNTWSLP